MEVELWSDLPQGSGLGTSSILAGCLIAVFWSILGRKFNKNDLINGVLFVEQLMTTGGGWQDQVIISIEEEPFHSTLFYYRSEA